MSPRTNLSLAALVLLAALTLFAAPGEAWAQEVLFTAFVEGWIQNAGIELSVVTRDSQGNILDQVQMDDVWDGNFEIRFTPNSQATTWEVWATPASRFTDAVIEDLDAVNFTGANQLDTPFEYF
ncbi:MAG: hypothetical protein FJY67_11310 [Calditrichaeota bacterium]|nr:hypothetical protein [Calditrichota bacterium]